MELRTNRITVRGQSYLVSEPSGHDQAKIRKAIANDVYKHKLEMFTAYLCCKEPVKTEDEWGAMPQAVIAAVATESMRLRDEDDADPKAPTTA